MKRWKALTGAVLAAALVVAPLVAAGATAADPVPTIVGQVGVLEKWNSDTNHEEYWENLYKDHKAECYSASGNTDHGTITDGGLTVTLKPFNQDWPGDHWELLVVKGGSVYNNVIVHPLAGVPYASTVNNGGQQAAVSHWIVCKGTTPQGEPEVITPTLSYTEPSCQGEGVLTKSEIGVTWTWTANPDGSRKYTATPKDDFMIADGATRSWDVPDLTKLSGAACAPVNDCGPGVGFHSTNLDDRWTSIDTRAKGHVAYVAGGLRVWTEDSTSLSKVSEGIAVDFPLHDTGVLDINATKNAGNVYPYGPGLNLFVDFDEDGDVDGTLVYEEVYGQDLWLTNGSQQFVKDAAPSHTGGNGSENHGTINEWLKAFPDAQVKGVAYTLGSGVQGDWTITSIVVNCSEYTFGAAPTTPVPAVFSAAPAAPTCLTEGALPTLGEHPNVTLAFDRAYAGPGVYTLKATAKAGFTFPDGTTVKTQAFTVAGKLATQSTDSAAPCYQAPPSSPTPTPASTPTPAALPATGGADMTPWGIGAALMLIAGAALLTTRRLVRR